MGDLIGRQAAIEALERIFDRCEEIEVHLPDGDPDKTEYKMFPDYMTVWKYLHQLPPAINDLISRQALMKEFSDFVRSSNNSDFAPTPTWNDAVSLVGSMPSAERRGLWEFNIDDKGWSWDEPYVCDQCGKWNGIETPYCPHCGAKMEGDAE